MLQYPQAHHAPTMPFPSRLSPSTMSRVVYHHAHPIVHPSLRCISHPPPASSSQPLPVSFSYALSSTTHQERSKHYKSKKRISIAPASNHTPPFASPSPDSHSPSALIISAPQLSHAPTALSYRKKRRKNQATSKNSRRNQHLAPAAREERNGHLTQTTISAIHVFKLLQPSPLR